MDTHPIYTRAIRTRNDRFNQINVAARRRWLRPAPRRGGGGRPRRVWWDSAARRVEAAAHCAAWRHNHLLRADEARLALLEFCERKDAGRSSRIHSEIWASHREWARCNPR